MKDPFPNLPFWAIFSLFFFFSSLSHQGSYFPPPFPNPRLIKAYTALQAWKHAITSDPQKFTENWCDLNVCNYTGVYCAPAPDDPNLLTVAGIDLNHANIAGSFPEELGLLTDLALFHINSNGFCGTLPKSFQNLHLLYELDVSNNHLNGPFPSVVLSLPSLKYLDIRFNEFDGEIPKDLFDLKLDALFINNNGFTSALPENMGNSPVSVLVLANNNLNSCLPPSLAKMAGTLNEIILTSVGLKGCLPPEVGLLTKVTVFDVSFNELVGPVPETMGNMKSLEQLNLAHNKLTGRIPESICFLPRLENFTYSYNYFCNEPPACLMLSEKNDIANCIRNRLFQRSMVECFAFNSRPVNCAAYGCSPRTVTPPPQVSPPPPKIYHPYP